MYHVEIGNQKSTTSKMINDNSFRSSISSSMCSDVTAISNNYNLFRLTYENKNDTVLTIAIVSNVMAAWRIDWRSRES